MKQMVISLVVEGMEEDLNSIKGNIINVASESLISCKVDVIEPRRKEIELPPVYANH